MKQIEHSHIEDASLLHGPFHYVQDSDPGAVGAGLWWLDTTIQTDPTLGDYVRIKYRNDTNDGWVTI